MQARLAKKPLERQDLTPVAQRVLSEQAQLRETVEHDPVGLCLADAGNDVLDGLAEFELGGMQDRLLAVGIEAHLVDELVEVDAVERPSVRRRGGAEFVRGFGQGDVERPFTAGRPLAEELERDGGLARARGALQQIEPARGQAAAENVVETGHAGRDPGLLAGRPARCGFGHRGGSRFLGAGGDRRPARRRSFRSLVGARERYVGSTEERSIRRVRVPGSSRRFHGRPSGGQPPEVCTLRGSASDPARLVRTATDGGGRASARVRPAIMPRRSRGS